MTSYPQKMGKGVSLKDLTGLWMD